MITIMSRLAACTAAAAGVVVGAIGTGVATGAAAVKPGATEILFTLNRMPPGAFCNASFSCDASIAPSLLCIAATSAADVPAGNDMRTSAAYCAADACSSLRRDATGTAFIPTSI